MADKKVLLGMDRFLALEWADYSLDLFLTSNDEKKNYEFLSNQIRNEISGIESARKTSNQLKRLWLSEKDGEQDLRSIAREIIRNQSVVNYSIFHLGMAINVFPIFYESCNKIGTLSKSYPYLSRQIIIRRVSETYANPSSIPRIVSRVIQTLVDWGFLLVKEDSYLVKQVSLEDKEISSWFVFALMKASDSHEISISDLLSNPNKMGINLIDIRSHINQSSFLKINRYTVDSEIITPIDWI
jgi:hypothetical protein